MGKVVLLLWILAILFGGFWFGYYQEGHNVDVTIETEGRGGMASDGKTYVTKDIFAVVDEKNGTKTTAIIVNVKEGTLTVINYGTKRYATVDLEFVDLGDCKRAMVGTPLENKAAERLPEAKTVAGYRCHAFKADTPIGSATAWYAYDFPTGRDRTALWNKLVRAKSDDLGVQAVLTLITGQASDEPPICTSYEYFPVALALEVTGRGAMQVEATKVTFGKVDASEFDVPSGFEEKTFLEALAQQQRPRRTR